MKYCINCGNEIKPGQKVCTKCGTPVEQKQVNNEVPKQQKPMPVHNSSPAPAPRKPMSKKTKMMLISALAGLILLIGLYKIIESQYDPVSVANKVSDAVKDKNADKLSELVTSNGEDIDKSEAKAFIDYLYDNDEAHLFIENVKAHTKSMKETKYPTVTIYNEYENELLRVAQDGKTLGLFQKYAFSIPTHQISLDAREMSKLKYKLKGKEQSVDLESGKNVKLGTLPLGNYKIPATKEVEGKKFDGNLVVNMGDGMTVEEEFEYTYLQIHAENTYSLDDSAYKIFINGKEVENHEDNNVVGPFEIGEEIDVQAKGTADGKEFKSSKEKVKIEKTENNENQEVTVKFDDALISKFKSENYDKQMKKEEEQRDRRTIDIQGDEFINEYSKAIHIDEFKGVKVGMTKEEVEDLLGEDSSYIDSNKENMKAYGNMGIEYDDKEKVKRILIVPDSWEIWDLENIEEFFGKPKYTEKNKDGETVYYIDGTRGNNFVFVIVMKDEETIKYLTQKPEEANDPWVN
ncbi:TcaA second domain-containing protein [Macrococcus armenti]|uniref:TcaA second domain-containing protein n=1 Tax=Macrococcus armenti TaxID=2875764 RepID=UPI001CCE6648|nr:zinc-ribbon domain-containing protein [Macrococcus armenti]UBH15344.1 zinc-ribbon domain-containing protein [Macrococcus armenti]UBH17701.1 zinc-ribbon domain-containing protein [Macrococcus armenti]UBH19969.1 zinc-ribbon domain-containing protein [Macrococcus armenti]